MTPRRCASVHAQPSRGPEPRYQARTAFSHTRPRAAARIGPSVLSASSEGLTVTHSDAGRRPPFILAILPQLIPSTLIGVVKPLLALHRERRISFDVALESWVSRRRLARADVVVFCRNTEPRYGAPLDAALAMGKPIIYELDDDFFAIPSGAPGWRSPVQMSASSGRSRASCAARCARARVDASGAPSASSPPPRTSRARTRLRSRSCFESLGSTSPPLDGLVEADGAFRLPRGRTET